jgi:hypothetical protein
MISKRGESICRGIIPFLPFFQERLQRSFFSITSFTQEKLAETAGKPAVLISEIRA